MKEWTPKRCKTCVFMSQRGNDVICRRNPPVPTVLAKEGRQGMKVQALTSWPVVIPETDWCGQHAEPKPAVKAA